MTSTRSQISCNFVVRFLIDCTLSDFMLKSKMAADDVIRNSR